MSRSATAGLTFPPALELHPNGLVDVLGEVQYALLLLLLLILRQSTGDPVKARHPRRHSVGTSRSCGIPRRRDGAEVHGRYSATATAAAGDHRHRPPPPSETATAAGAARATPLLTAIFPAPPPPPPPPPLAISFGTARSDVAPRRSPLAARGGGAGRPGRALGALCGRVRPGPGRNKAAAAARQARHGGVAGPAPPLAVAASAAAGQWLCRAVPSPSHARAPWLRVGSGRSRARADCAACPCPEPPPVGAQGRCSPPAAGRARALAAGGQRSAGGWGPCPPRFGSVDISVYPALFETFYSFCFTRSS